jgi:hypothetical protein
MRPARQRPAHGEPNEPSPIARTGKGRKAVLSTDLVERRIPRNAPDRGCKWASPRRCLSCLAYARAASSPPRRERWCIGCAWRSLLITKPHELPRERSRRQKQTSERRAKDYRIHGVGRPRDGAFTAAEADRGRASCRESCARCHGQELAGEENSPLLVASSFLARKPETGTSPIIHLVGIGPLSEPQSPLTRSDFGMNHHPISSSAARTSTR